MKQKVFTALLNGADDFMRAALLMAMNCCMYAGEVVTVKWNELDLEKRTFVSARRKTGVVRVGVLWPRTIEALNKMPRVGDSVFITVFNRVQHTYKSFHPYFSRLREATGTKGAQFSHIRDGAYTAACAHSKVLPHHAKMLAGHQTGEDDKYVERRPKMVSRACRAIERAYFPPPRDANSFGKDITAGPTTNDGCKMAPAGVEPVG